MAVVGFFAVAFAGTLGGVPAHVCSLRALVGAAAMYVLTRMAGGVVVRMVADAAVRGMTTQQQKGASDNGRE